MINSMKKDSKLIVSSRTLKILAAAIWYIGSVILLFKGRQLLLEAHSIRPDLPWAWMAVVLGVALGIVKARYIFNRSCRRNLRRIDALESPKLWQFYAPKFFLALALMITAGAILSRLAHDIYPFLIGVGALDLALSSALLISSHIYWLRPAT
jgi:hypothetical protein